MTQSIDAVLPLTVRDMQRAQILCRSLVRNLSDLGTLWVVVPDAQLPAMQQYFAAQSVRVPGLRVVSERSIVPELDLIRPGGWYRQQLVKLAIAEHVASPCYLTLDADVICTRAVSSAELAPDGKPGCYVIPEDLHPDWYRGSEGLLGLRATRTGILHNVTPAVLVRDAVLELRDFLQAKPLQPGLRGAKQAAALALGKLAGRSDFARWRVLLAAGTPWTEYGVYYTFLEATGRFDRYHTHAPRAIYDIERSLWRADRDRFDAWDPTPCFTGDGPPWFIVVQSNAGIDPKRVRAKMEPFVG